MNRYRRENRTRRPAFTLIEMLVAAALAALVTASAAMMINGVANASINSAEYRAAKAEGMTSMSRITKRIRAARAIGDISQTSMMLWEEDKDGDDKIDNDELSLFTYDAPSKSVSRVVMDPNLLSDLGAELGVGPLLDKTVFELLSSGQAKLDPIATDVENFKLSGYPDDTDARIVNLWFEKPITDDRLSFRDAASPRAPGDYMFVDEAKVFDDASGRWVRTKVSRWTGFADVRGETVTFPN